MAGGVVVHVPMKYEQPFGGSDGTYSSANDVFKLDVEAIDAAFTERTKALIINSPQNPTGKVLSPAEMRELTDCLDSKSSSIVVVSDEVYENIMFDGESHVSFAAFNNCENYHRTLTLSTIGKTFSCTGWKVGWAVGPSHLIKPVAQAQQWVVFTAPTPTQDTAAACLRKAREPYDGFPSYYAWLSSEYASKRALCASALQECGIDAHLPRFLHLRKHGGN